MLSSVKISILVPYRRYVRNILFQNVFHINNIVQVFTLYIMLKKCAYVILYNIATLYFAVDYFIVYFHISNIYLAI